MSKIEILDELPKLTKEERFEIDDDDPLSEEQKALLEARLRDMDLHRKAQFHG